MGFEVEIFSDDQLQADFLEWLVEEKWPGVERHFGKMWDYYTNRKVEVSDIRSAGQKINESGRYYVQAQEHGLPSRITGLVASGTEVFGGRSAGDIQRKEVVIENDIGWRISAMVDFLFGKPISFVSKTPDVRKRAEIESILKALFAANGGIGFFQDMAVLGGVYGFVDCIIRPGDKLLEKYISNSSKIISHEEALQSAAAIDLELIEAPRALPVLEENNYKR